MIDAIIYIQFNKEWVIVIHGTGNAKLTQTHSFLPRRSQNLFRETHTQDFSGGSEGKESACSAGDLEGVDLWIRKIPWREEWIRSIFAWRIPRTEEPDRLKSMGSQTVGHDWATNTYTPNYLWNMSQRSRVKCKGKNILWITKVVIDPKETWRGFRKEVNY